MSLKKRVFLVDVDNTLIDTEGIKNYWHKTFKGKFLKAYNQSKLLSGFLDINHLARHLSVKKTFFHETPFGKFLFPYASTFLKAIKSLGKTIILSLGAGKYQELKISGSGIERIVGQKNVIITSDKKSYLSTIITKLKTAGYSTIFIIDDRADMLETAFGVNSNIQSVWLRYGSYKKTKPNDKMSISYEVNSLQEAEYFLRNFVAGVNSQSVNFRSSVLKNITAAQIERLITLTKYDASIKKFTHDKERFKSKKAFDTWKKRNKTIYTLVDSSQKLLGIIWFAKEKFGKYRYTFAVRLYPPARGKGLAHQFMKYCFEDFGRHRFWLSTLKSNKAAIASYKRFGFKEHSSKNEGLIMTLN